MSERLLISNVASMSEMDPFVISLPSCDTALLNGRSAHIVGDAVGAVEGARVGAAVVGDLVGSGVGITNV